MTKQPSSDTSSEPASPPKTSFKEASRTNGGLGPGPDPWPGEAKDPRGRTRTADRAVPAPGLHT